MKALTIWQPWASLIMIGAKPNEFRKWDYRYRNPKIMGERIAIHAGAREIRPTEIMRLLTELERGYGSLIPARALPLLRRVAAAYKCQHVLELGAVLGSAIIGRPFKVEHFAPDSDRVSHHLWAWPMLDVEVYPEPIPTKGLQGFWNFSLGPTEAIVPTRSALLP